MLPPPTPVLSYQPLMHSSATVMLELFLALPPSSSSSSTPPREVIRCATCFVLSKQRRDRSRLLTMDLAGPFVRTIKRARIQRRTGSRALQVDGSPDRGPWSIDCMSLVLPRSILLKSYRTVSVSSVLSPQSWNRGLFPGFLVLSTWVQGQIFFLCPRSLPYSSVGDESVDGRGPSSSTFSHQALTDDRQP